MYRSNFECPIPEGTPCTSVTQIESMIVERKEGPDLFVLTDENDCTCAYPKIMRCASLSKKKRRIWLSSHTGPNEVPIKGRNVFVEIR